MPSSAARTGRRLAALLADRPPPLTVALARALVIGAVVVGAMTACSALDRAGGPEVPDLGSDVVPPPALAATGTAVPILSADPAVRYEVGTCLHRPTDDVAARPLPCDDPHTIEIYGVVDLPGGPSAPYPGLDAATDVCGTAFQDLTGVAPGLATVFQRSLIRPSEATWAAGKRTVTCYAVYPDVTDRRLVAIDPLRAFGRVSTFALRRGDCLVDFTDEATWLAVVPCREPHDAEVFADLVLPAGPFPGDAELQALADELCYGQSFDLFVGRDYASSSLTSLVSRPTAETWLEGDRSIGCILTDGLVRTGSLADSGR